MGNRMILQEKLESILGTREVYYQPPETIKMRYPAILYNRKDLHTSHADNCLYSSMTVYELTLIDENPDSEFVERIAELPYCSFDRHYTANGLNHEVFTIYF